MSDKTRKNLKNACAAACFALVFLVLFQLAFTVLLDKEQTWYKQRNYAALPGGAVDILYVGNSHFGAAIDAALVDETVGAGTYGFNYSCSGMRMEYAYHRLASALATQSPRLVVLDTFCLVPVQEGEGGGGVINWSLDGMPLTGEKLAAVRELAPREDWAAYLVPFIKYHARWEDLSAEDVAGAFDASLYDWFGRRPETTDRAMDREDDHFEQDLSAITEEAPVDGVYMEYLERFIDLAEENGAQVLLLGVPYRSQFGQNSADGVRVDNYLRGRVVDGDAVRLLDLNERYAQMAFGYGDMRDDGHVNYAGSEKASRFLGAYIRENYPGLSG